MSEPVWLTPEIVISLHAGLIDTYGGLYGLRDRALLESAVARPQQLHAYGSPGLEDMAAAGAFAILRNHPFVDGNKRAALAFADIFLQINGLDLASDEAEAVVFIRDVAASELGEAELAAWIKANVEPVG